MTGLGSTSVVDEIVLGRSHPFTALSGVDAGYVWKALRHDDEASWNAAEFLEVVIRTASSPLVPRHEPHLSVN